jgi:hypothetical protein
MISRKLKLFFSIKNLLFIFLLLKSIIIVSLIQPKRVFAVDDPTDPTKFNYVTVSRIIKSVPVSDSQPISRQKYHEAINIHNETVENFNKLKNEFEIKNSLVTFYSEEIGKIFGRLWNFQTNSPHRYLKNDGGIKELLGKKMIEYIQSELPGNYPIQVAKYEDKVNNFYFMVPTSYTKKSYINTIEKKNRIKRAHLELQNLNTNAVLLKKKQEQIVRLANAVWNNEKLIREIRETDRKDEPIQQQVKSSQKRKKDEADRDEEPVTKKAKI